LQIVKDLLVKSSEGGVQGGATRLQDDEEDSDWCREEDLPEETRWKVEGLKTMARWLLGLKQDKLAAQKTFRMLTAFIANKGDLLQYGKMRYVPFL
jgi:sister-chromatid-cohesion protein PDS5